MFRRIMPLVMLVVIAVLAVILYSGGQGRFAAAASRLPGQFMDRAQNLRTEMEGQVVILHEIVAPEDEEKPDEPVVLKDGEPGTDGAASSADAPVEPAGSTGPAGSAAPAAPAPVAPAAPAAPAAATGSADDAASAPAQPTEDASVDG